jgi:hypothetical protein
MIFIKWQMFPQLKIACPPLHYQEVHACCHNELLMYPTLSRFTSVHIFKIKPFKINLNTVPHLRFFVCRGLFQ